MFSSPPLPRSPRLAALASALSVLGLVLGGPEAWAQTTGASAFAMGYFTESPNGLASDYGLHLAVSDDGREWTPLNQNAPVVTPTLGTTRAFEGLGATEAPIVVKSLDRDEWTMWGDVYTPVNGRFFAWRSGNITQDAWEPLSQRLYTQPINSKHATIVALTSAEKSALLSRYGAPAWIRLKSYNYPDRYVRHANHEGRVDPYPMDPYTDSQFRLVGGLASSSGVSLQSVTDPGLYLRHSGFEVRLERDDGSAGFAADATFTRTAGLANASWTTLRSWNYSDRVLRHQGFRLRIDPINASSPLSDREDATFALTR